LINKEQDPFSAIQREIGELVACVIGIILVPRRMMGKVISEKGYIAPLVLLTLAFVVLRLLMLPEIYEQYSGEEFRQWYMEMRDVSEDVAQKDIDKMISNAPLMMLIEGPLTVVVGTVAVAFILSIVGRIVFKEHREFKPIFTMVAWSSIISAIPMLLNIPLKIIENDWFLPTSLSFILTPELVGGYFSRFLSIVDPFLVWQVWLLSIGMSTLYDVTVQRAVGVVGTIFVFFGVVNAMFGG